MMSQSTEVECKLTVLQSEMNNCISKRYLNSFRCFYIIVGTQHLTCMRTLLMELLVNTLTYLPKNGPHLCSQEENDRERKD